MGEEVKFPKALDIEKGNKIDPTFYSFVYGADKSSINGSKFRKYGIYCYSVKLNNIVPIILILFR